MSSIVDEVFGRFLESKIFANREFLRPEYIPDELPHREEQISRLASALAPILRGERGSNVFIYGLTGTGKTVVTKFVAGKLHGKATSLKLKFGYAYVNCRQSDTPYRVFADLAESVGVKVPFTGLSTAEVFRRFLRGLKANYSSFLVVLDEVDYLVKKYGDDVLYRIVRIGETIPSIKMSVIGITNDINLVESLDMRIRSSLGEVEIVFPPYNAEQLKDILQRRAEKAFNPNALDEGVIELCAALAAREHGDARRALDLLRIAGEIAEREGAKKVTIGHVYKAREEIERDRVRELVYTMPLHAKLVLLAIYSMSMDKGYTITGEVYNQYTRFCKTIRVEQVTRRRVSDIISELDMLGLIRSKVVSRGRYGKTRIIRPVVKPDIVLKTLESDIRLEKIVKSIRI